MKKLLLALLALAAVATLTAASAAACHGGHWSHRRDGATHFRTVGFAARHGWFRHDEKHHWLRGEGVFEKLHGTGSSFADGSATASGAAFGRPLRDGSFSASISTDWSKVTNTWFGGSCAPATGTLSLASRDGTDTLETSDTGVTCTVASNPWNVAAVFFGKGEVTNVTGKLSTVTGEGRVLLLEKTDGTVEGFSFAGFHGDREHDLMAFSRNDEHRCEGAYHDGYRR